MLLAILLQCFSLRASPLAATYVLPHDVESALIQKYVERAATKGVAQRPVDVEVTLEARLVSLNKQATLRTLRSISGNGAVTYTTLYAQGDGMLIREVISRYLAGESERHDMAKVAVTPLNYRFRIKGVVDNQSRQIFVFQLAPRKKNVGLFKGELWVDGQTGLPVHEAGLFIRSPSIFIKRLSFTRDFAMREGVNVPVHTHITVDSRLAGRVELNIQFADADPARPTGGTHDAE